MVPCGRSGTFARVRHSVRLMGNPMPNATPAPTGVSSLSDEAVVTRVREGETGLFELLMRRHNQRLYRTVRAILRSDEGCEDVMQQAYINAFRHLDGFQGEAQFSTWLTRIAINEAILRGRRRDRRGEVPLAEDAVETRAPTTSPDPEHTAYATELARMLEGEIDALPEVYRVVFVLREIEGLSTAETAESLGINEFTVKSRLHRAKARLRGAIAQRLGTTAAGVYAFHLRRCDRIVAAVLEQIR